MKVVFAVLLATLWTFPLLSYAAPLVNSRSFDQRFTITLFGEKNWESLLNTTSNGELVKQIAPGLLRYSAIVTNNTSFSIIGIAVQFIFHDNPFNATGHKDMGPAHFYHTFTGDANYILPPHGTLLITPEYELNLLSATPSLTDDLLAHLTRDAASTLRKYEQMGSITIELDSIWLADGRVVGPDKTKQLSTVLQNVEAWNDLVDEIRTRVKNGSSPEQLSAWLSDTSRTRVQDTIRTSGGYDHFRKMHARSIAALARRGRIDDLKPLPMPRFRKGEF
jgi:hypothetical protein